MKGSLLTISLATGICRSLRLPGRWPTQRLRLSLQSPTPGASHSNRPDSASLHWSILRYVFLDLALPLRLLDIPALKAGRFRACWNILVLAFFCRRLAQQRNNDSFTCYFAHTLSKELSAFLQSKACVAALRKAGALPQQRDGQEPWPQRPASPRSGGHRGPLQLLQSRGDDEPDASRAPDRDEVPRRTVGISAGGSIQPLQQGGNQMQGSLAHTPAIQEHLVSQEHIQPLEEAPAAVRRPHQQVATTPAHLNYRPFLEDAAADVQHVHRARVSARQPRARAAAVPSPELHVSKKTTAQAQVETQHRTPLSEEHSAGQSSCQEHHDGGTQQPAGAGDSWQGVPPAGQAGPAPRPPPAVQPALPQHSRIPPVEREASAAEQLSAQHQQARFCGSSRSQWQPDHTDGDGDALYEPICGKDSAGVLMRKLVRRLAMVQVNLATLAGSETAGEQYGSAQWHSQCLREMHYLQALLAETQVHLKRAGPISRHQQLKARMEALIDDSSSDSSGCAAGHESMQKDTAGLSEVPQHIKEILQQSRARRKRQGQQLR
eukprot:jgi/Astpho2/910/fgenesh1_pg.00016_%23_107_t